MNIESGRRVVGLVLASWCVSAFAGGELADPAVGGDWNADATWSGGVRPQAGEVVVVKPTADAKVTLSADDATDYKSLTFYSSSAINKAAGIEFDGSGKTLVMPYSEAGNYDAKPFVFLDGNGKNILYVNDANLSEGDKTKAAPVRLTDAHFKLSQTADGSSTFVLDRGKMDFCTDAGDAAANRELYMQKGLAKKLTVAVTNAVLEVPKFFGSWNNGNDIFFSFDHATFTSRGYAQFADNNRWYYSDCDITAKDSTFNFRGDAYFGRGESKTFVDCVFTGGSINPAWTKDVLFKNCTMDLTGNVSVGNEGGFVDDRGGVFTDLHVTFDGGTYAFGQSAVGGAGSCTATMTVMGGATVDWRSAGKASGAWGASVGGRGTGVVEVVSGLLRTDAELYNELQIGDYADSYGVGRGRLAVRGGKVQVRVGNNIYGSNGLGVGGFSPGELELSGGVVEAPFLSVGYKEPKLACTSVVHQTGGKLILNQGEDGAVLTDPRWSRIGLSYSAARPNYDDKDTAHPAVYYFEGGEIEAGRIVGGKGSRCQGGTGYSLFSADGGVFRMVMSRGTYTNIAGLDRCEVGDGGLTIDSNGYETKVEQDIVNKDGEEGLVVKAGNGTLLYSGNLTASALVVSGGVWQVVSGNVSSHVTLAPGVVFSTAGDVTDVTVAGLSLTNATLQLDPGDVITVNGPVAWDGLIVQFTSAPAKDEARSFLKIQGALDESALAVLRRAFFNVTLADGTHAKFDASCEDDVTTVSVAVVDDVDPIGPEGTVSWTGDGSWSSPANWMPATVPGVANKASFASDSAGKEVSVDAADMVGAISFGTDGYALMGEGSIEIAAEQGAAEIGATAAGTNTVDVPLYFDTVVNAPLAAGAKVSLAQPITGGGVNKTGLGTLALGADNDFSHSVTLGGGWMELATGRSAGASETVPLVMKAGGLRFDNADKEPVILTRAVQTSAGNSGLVLDAETEATIPFTSEVGWSGGADAGGFLYKRGTGDLTLELQRDTWITQGYSTPYWNFGITFDENGLADPDSQIRGALTVAEGLLRIKARPGLQYRPKLTLTKELNVGGIYRTAKADPVLELDGVMIDMRDGALVYVGTGMGASDTPNVTSATLRLTNNAELCVGYGKLGYRTCNGVVVRIEMIDSKFTGSTQTYLGGDAGTTRLEMQCVDSTFLAGNTLLIIGGIAADFTNSTVCANGGDYRLQFSPSYANDRPSCGYMRFADGSRLEMKSILWHTTNADHDKLYLKNFRLVFDDGTWDIGDADLTLSDTADPKVNLEKFSVELQAGGLKLPVAAGRTISTDACFWGEGGIEKSGEGTLKFGPGAYQFKGPMCALAGTVDLSGAGTITNGCFGAGAGTIADGTLKDPVFRLDAGAPNLVNCTFSGRGYLDVGDEPLEQPYPTDMTVLRFTGTAPNVSNWRLRGAGKKGLGAKFTVVGNEVKVTIEERGLLLLVR